MKKAMALSWVTVAWSAAISASLTLALVNLLVWARDRTSRSHLLFATASVANAVFGAVELGMLRANSPGHLAVLLRWAYLPFFVTFCCLIGFVRLYLDAGRPWLAWAAIGTGGLSAVVLNFLSPGSLRFTAIERAIPVRFLGETVSVPGGVLNPWVRVGQVSGLLFLAFVVDAGIGVWRRGDRRRALTICGGMFLFMAAALVNAALVNLAVARLPFLVTFTFLGVLLAMGQELSVDIVRARELARELRASEAELREKERRMSLAANAAEIALWALDIPNDSIWITPGGRALYGVDDRETIDVARFLSALHVEERDRIRCLFEESVAGSGDFQTEYRVVRPDGKMLWIATRGAVERDASGSPTRMYGVSFDITPLKEAERELLRKHGELAHLSRVSMLGELSGSLAHELNQPLTAILSNAQAARRLLARDEPDVTEVREILNDIVDQDRRAGDVIQRLRQMLKKGEVQRLPLDVTELILESLRLMRGELAGRGVAVTTELAADMPVVSGDRVQLQQVLLNLVLNASDAMAALDPADRRLLVRAERDGDGGVRISVSDRGCGIPADQLEAVFEPFVTTKAEGLGLGLAVCRTIVRAHGGEIRAENNGEGTPGATLHFFLPGAVPSP